MGLQKVLVELVATGGVSSDSMQRHKKMFKPQELEESSEPLLSKAQWVKHFTHFGVQQTSVAVVLGSNPASFTMILWRSAGSLCNTVKSLGRGTALDMRHETLGQLCYDCDVLCIMSKARRFRFR